MRQRTAAVEKIDARKRFGSFKKEEPKAIRKTKVDSSLKERVLEEWKQFGEWLFIRGGEVKLKDKYTKEEIEKISLMLGDLPPHDSEDYSEDYSDEYFWDIVAGDFISALIKYSPDQDFVLRLAEKVAYVGIWNTKNITVIGDVGDSVGADMESGKIIVKGNAGPQVGEGMKGGEIHIEGEIEGIGSTRGGRIYHKGKLVAGDD